MGATTATIDEALRNAVALLRSCSSTPRLDAEVLLAHALGMSRASLLSRFADTLVGADAMRYGSLVERRRSGEPVAYITGRREFWGLDFEVTPAVLIPRPETELIVEAALGFLSDAAHHWRIADVGTISPSTAARS